MGGVCAKNDAGKAASDIPNKPMIKRGDKMLESTQKSLSQSQTEKAQETKWITASDNFNVDKGIELKADDKAVQVAAAWVKEHPEWEYTGQWKNERNAENTGEVSMFEVRKIVVVDTDAPAPIIMEEETKMEDLKRPAEVLDQKQSFVDQVSEGLAKKVSSDRFENTDKDEEEKKKDEASVAATADETKEGSPADGKSPAKAVDGEADDAPVEANTAAEEEAKIEEESGPKEQEDAVDAAAAAASDDDVKQDSKTEEAKQEPVEEEPAKDADAKSEEGVVAPVQAADDKTEGKESDVAEGLGAEDDDE